MKKRIISAAIMIAICIPFLVLGGLLFKIGIGLLACLAYKEIVSIKGIEKYPKGVIFLGLVAMLVLVYSNNGATFSVLGLDYSYLMFAFLAMFLPCIFYYNTKKYTTTDAFSLTGFIFFIGIIFNLTMNLYLYEKAYFLLIILVAILTDTFAYFTGMAIGKHKCSKISPKKSIEGFAGGIIMGTVLCTIYYVNFIGASPLVKVIPVIVVLCAMCELGDLFYSAVKRNADIKDFSNLIPGHGGILDRIDSLTFVLAAYILLSSFI